MCFINKVSTLLQLKCYTLLQLKCITLLLKYTASLRIDIEYIKHTNYLIVMFHLEKTNKVLDNWSRRKQEL